MGEISGFFKEASSLEASGEQWESSPSGRFLLMFHGAIYHASDTEVLLEAIERYGLKEALKARKGMFALALYDKQEQTLFLARDRVGEKPLFYGFVDKVFVFASDLRIIAASENFCNPIYTDVLSLYFIHGYIPAPYSIYRDIYKLEAGTILEIKAPFKGYSTYPYWSMKEAALYGQSHLFKGSRIEAADELERLIKKAIREQVVADVPVGAFLSAGIDSSTITALMQAELTESVKSFTIGLPEGANDEAVHAKKIAAHLGLDHTEHYISEQDVKEIIPLLSSMYGEPFADSSQIPTYLVSKITSEHVDIALGGDAGDELFCGYNSYRSVERAYRKLKRIPYWVRYPVSRLLLNGPIPLSKNNEIRANLLPLNSAAELYVSSLEYSPILRKICLTDVDIPYKYNELNPHFLSEPNHQLMLMDMLMYTPDDILVKVERSAAAVGLQIRTPMLDKDVIEFAWSLPIAYKRNEEMGKLVLRDVLYRYVPRELMERPKQGFSVPIEKWLKEPALRSWAEQLISRETLLRQGILNPDVVHQIWDDFINQNHFVPQIWHILMFQSFMLEK